MGSQLKQSLGIIEAVWTHPANHGKRLRSVMRFFGWQFLKRTFGRALVVDFHGRKLKCYPDSTSSSSVIYFDGLPDYWEMKFIQAYLRPGDHFLDVGANVGVYTILAASCVGEGGSVDAFEPMEGTAKRIEDQVALNKLNNVEVHRLAAGEENKTVDFGYANNSAMMHMRRKGEAGAGAVPVQSIRLDDFKPGKHYAMGKMDIEGAEPLALKGALNKLYQANPPVWLLELAGYSQFYGMSSEEVIDFLKSNGYVCGVYEPEERNVVFTDQPWTLGVQNILAISEKHKDVVMRIIQMVGGQ